MTTTGLADLDAQIDRFFDIGRAPPRKLGRNASCWCGSGVKYKRCHWDADQRTRHLPKMSEILEEIAEPLIVTGGRQPKATRAALDLAAIAWNLSRLAEPTRSDAVQDALGRLATSGGLDLVLADLIDHADLWPDDPRCVVRVGIAEQPDGSWQILAASARPND
jgi:hypothetical protein